MRIGDHLYFAPGIRFGEIDLAGADLPGQYHKRILGLYIQPSMDCAEQGHNFAAGLLIVACIDALARVKLGGAVGKRFKTFSRDELKSVTDEGRATRFYDEVRNGLVHEGRLKNGAQFSSDFRTTVQEIDGLLLINPTPLAGEVTAALSNMIGRFKEDPAELARLATSLRRDHRADFRAASA